MNKYVNPNIAKISSYRPPLEGRAGKDLLRLDFNERTIPVCKKVVQAVASFPVDSLNIYPEYGNLCEKIAEYAGVSAKEVMITNGSDQGMELIFRAFTKERDQVIIPSPSFAMFFQCASICGSDVIVPLYDKDGSFPLEQVLKKITDKTRLVIICNPNNPTGTLLKLKSIEVILKKAFSMGAIVYVDEAYYEFSGLSAVKLISKYPNLIITRTFSKAFGLASLRIGYMVSNESNIYEMLKIRGPYDVNMRAVRGAGASLEQLEDMQNYVSEVMNVAKPMLENFLRNIGVYFMPSSSNFLLCKFDNASEITEKLRENGILVRPQSASTIDGYIRITIGTKKQMERFMQVLNSILN